jgi:hypothetical protein
MKIQDIAKLLYKLETNEELKDLKASEQAQWIKITQDALDYNLITITNDTISKSEVIQ